MDAPAPSPPKSRSLATTLRLGGTLGLQFMLLGIWLPFFAPYLESRGLDRDRIGLIFAGMTIVRIPILPWIGRAADRWNRSRLLIGVLAAASLAAFSGIFLVDGFGPIFGVLLIYICCSCAVIPLTENLAVVHSAEGRVDFGRVRVIGSLAFLGTALGVGHLLEAQPISLVPVLLCATWALVLLSTPILPEMSRVAPGAEGRLSALGLLRRRDFVLALVVAGLVQSSHAVYYSYGSILWKDVGLDEGTIGALWATGVLAEVVLFVFQARLFKGFKPSHLLMLGAAGGVLRCVLTAETDDPALLFPLQCLHALSFAATHLGAMRYLQVYIPRDSIATGQALYSSIVTGVFLGLANLLAASLVEDLGRLTYFSGAVSCTLALLLGLWLRLRKRRKERLGLVDVERLA
ncbi:MAG: MFS transporter [Planctomycetota bacterium]